MPTDRSSQQIRVLVVANETLASEALREVVLASGPASSIHIVAPALSSRVAFWTSDNRHARSAAERRLQACVEGLRRTGLNVEGAIGDANPLVAIEDALRVREVDLIVIVTHPRGRSNWLERRVVERARQRLPHAIVHVVAGEDGVAVAA
jgi:hypothetical protein